MARNSMIGERRNVTQSVTVIDELPEASFWVSTLMGDNHTVFEFDASWSSDLETALADLDVRWDWEGDGVWDTSWSKTKTETHQFATGGTYNVTLEVRDSANQTDESVVRVMVQGYVIPEFQGLIVPVLGMAGLVVLVSAVRRRRR